MLVCTVVGGNHLSRAYRFAETVRRHHPDAIRILCVVEREIPRLPDHAPLPFEHVLTVGEIGMPDMPRFMFRHAIFECATAIKPRLLRGLFAKFPQEDTLIFLDPDIELHGPLLEAIAALDTSDIVVTPHHVSEGEAERNGKVQRFLCGLFNLGFLGLRRSAVSDALLSWWQEKCERQCYADIPRGLYVDQKWFDHACGIFPLGILREPGYNLARWNASERPVIETDGGLTVLGRPLRFIHHSQIGWDGERDAYLRAAPRGDEPVHALRRQYLERIDELDRMLGPGPDWSYGTYYSGESIAPEARIAYRSTPELMAACADPFAQSNAYFIRPR